MSIRPLGSDRIGVSGGVSGVVSGVGATYNRYTYFNEKREALAQWAAHIGEILRG